VIDRIDDFREIAIQKEELIIEIIITLMRIKMFVDGMYELKTNGSKDEKMSDIIQVMVVYQWEL
jgi:hypothetical protein